jgi:hypothetical protein
VIFNLAGDQFLESLNIPELLCLQLGPEVLQLIAPFGIGKILVVAPQAIQSTAQLMDQIMVVIRAAACFTQMRQFLLSSQRHIQSSFHFQKPLLLLRSGIAAPERAKQGDKKTTSAIVCRDARISNRETLEKAVVRSPNHQHYRSNATKPRCVSVKNCRGSIAIRGSIIEWHAEGRNLDPQHPSACFVS